MKFPFGTYVLSVGLGVVLGLGCSKDGAALPVADQACAVTTSRTPPFKVNFRFRNTGTRPLWMGWGACGTDLSITSCADRHMQDYGPRFRCACSCDDSSCRGGIVCGACPPAEQEFAPLEMRDLDWLAASFVDVQRTGYSCVRRTDLSAGTYRITVPIYLSADATKKRAAVRTIVRDFVLPLPNDRLDIDLDLGEPDAGAVSSDAALGCSIGADQTCNDLPTVSTLWGRCSAAGQCVCNDGFSINPATGRCRKTP